MLNLSVVGPLDPCFVWDGAKVSLTLPTGPGSSAGGMEGAFAGVGGPHDDGGGAASLARDPLGLNKLFWADAGDRIEVAARPSRLTSRGHSLDACSAVPANSLISYPPDGGPPTVSPIASGDRPDAADATRRAADAGVAGHGGEPEPLEQIARRIRATTAAYVEAVLEQRPGPVVVCLSGGLDSTSVAALVREHRDDVIAVTFDLARPEGRRDHSSGTRRSDDARAALQAARHLGLTLTEAIHPPDHLLDLVDVVLEAGIDWRDFNVHAGLVNAGLGVTIAEMVGERSSETTVFTGDLVNEFLADYHEETYRGQTYYRLPRLPLPQTRATLVRGLETSHREIGVFGHFGLTVVQPYAAARADFLRLPADILGPGDGKSQLYQLMFGAALPRTSYERPKTRAQTGSAEGDLGVLAACVDAGIDARWLADRFAQLHHAPDSGALRSFLRAGRYRTAIPRGDHDRTQ